MQKDPAVCLPGPVHILCTVPPAMEALTYRGDELKKSLLLLALVLAFLPGCHSPESWRSYGGDGSRCLCAHQPGPNRP
ncbi:MAG TPA: hypothetical protein DEA85_07000, partial [Firmicutes bacterium]|nr:hypothetical protein [Bacillota bacterium]